MSLAAARRAAAVLVVGLVIATAIEGSGRQGGSDDASPVPPTMFGGQHGSGPVAAPRFGRSAGEKPKRCLETSRLERARRFAGHRSGSIAFAFLDECRRLVGEHRYRAYPSASVVKAMLLVAYLRRGDVADRELGSGERDLLGRMIEQSDNDAADDVFAIVGEDGLNEVAEAAGMHRFASNPSWGSSGITAADQASFLGGIERYVPRRHESYTLKILASVIDSQRWGIPQVRPQHWSVRFKGGWYPADDSGWRVNQVATLRRGSRSFALAVLSDGNPSLGYGEKTIEGVAKRLMGGYRR